MSVSLSVVQFLNTKPLAHALERRLVDHDFTLSYDVPSVCARKIREGQADLGIIPSIEYARSATPYAIVPEVAIASHGPVRSIYLFHTVPIDQIRAIAMDSSSRTSVALTHIILNDRYHRSFESIEHPPTLDDMLGVADAALIIGDPALEAGSRKEPHLDLGQEWRELTGLPFVYAFWAGYPDRLTPSQVHTLIRARELGLTALTEIATEYARNHTQTASFYESYMRDYLVYTLGEEEQKGLLEFYRRAQRLELIDRVPALGFYDR